MEINDIKRERKKVKVMNFLRVTYYLIDIIKGDKYNWFEVFGKNISCFV